MYFSFPLLHNPYPTGQFDTQRIVRRHERGQNVNFLWTDRMAAPKLAELREPIAALHQKRRHNHIVPSIRQQRPVPIVPVDDLHILHTIVNRTPHIEHHPQTGQLQQVRCVEFSGAARPADGVLEHRAQVPAGQLQRVHGVLVGERFVKGAEGDVW